MNLRKYNTLSKLVMSVAAATLIAGCGSKHSKYMPKGFEDVSLGESLEDMKKSRTDLVNYGYPDELNEELETPEMGRARYQFDASNNLDCVIFYSKLGYKDYKTFFKNMEEKLGEPDEDYDFRGRGGREAKIRVWRKEGVYLKLEKSAIIGGTRYTIKRISQGESIDTSRITAPYN
jgi:hypothetical protein